MASDDKLYALVLVLSLPLGALLPLLPPSIRASGAGAAGGVLAVLACGLRSAAYSLCSIGLTCVALRLAPRRHHGPVCFACAFGCLFALRLLSLLTVTTGPANALQLVLTLRLASLGFDSADGVIGEAGHSAPPVAPVLQYALCYHGHLSGPFVRFSDWAAAMRQPSAAPTAEAWTSAARALAGAAAALAVWRGVASLLPYKPMAAAEAWWLALPLPRRVAYFYLSSYQHRFRFYACWLLIEAAGTLARFPQPGNVRLLSCETAGCPSVLIAGWNLSVHRFLRDYVYRRLPFRSRFRRKLATYAVSAAWHGLRPGYYLFFFGVFAMAGVEEFVRAAAAVAGALPLGGVSEPRVGEEGKRSAQRSCSCSSEAQPAAVPVRRRQGMVARTLSHPLTHLLCHFWTMGCLSYFGAAFNVLGLPATMALWRGLGYYGIWMLAAPAAGAAAVFAAAGGARPQRSADTKREHQD
jgi:hypothetical protein